MKEGWIRAQRVEVRGIMSEREIEKVVSKMPGGGMMMKVGDSERTRPASLSSCQTADTRVTFPGVGGAEQILGINRLAGVVILSVKRFPSIGRLPLWFVLIKTCQSKKEKPVIEGCTIH